MLALLGLNKAAMVKIKGSARRNAFIMVGVAVMLVMLPLIATGQKITREAIAEIQSQRAAAAWVENSDYCSAGLCRHLGILCILPLLEVGSRRRLLIW